MIEIAKITKVAISTITKINKKYNVRSKEKINEIKRKSIKTNLFSKKQKQEIIKNTIL